MSRTQNVLRWVVATICMLIAFLTGLVVGIAPGSSEGTSSLPASHFGKLVLRSSAEQTRSPEKVAERQLERRYERLDARAAVDLAPLRRNSAPPEAALKRLIHLSCLRRGDDYPFWKQATPLYAFLAHEREALTRPWPPHLYIAYNQICVTQTDRLSRLLR